MIPLQGGREEVQREFFNDNLLAGGALEEALGSARLKRRVLSAAGYLVVAIPQRYDPFIMES